MTTADDLLEGLKASLFAHLTGRVVRRGLVDPAQADQSDLERGVVCVVSRGGGNFANYLGREGQLGAMEVALVCFVKVDDSTQPQAVETAELALLDELLAWTGGGVGFALPREWRQSEQQEHPYGWLVLTLDVNV